MSKLEFKQDLDGYVFTSENENKTSLVVDTMGNVLDGSSGTYVKTGYIDDDNNMCDNFGTPLGSSLSSCL